MLDLLNTALGVIENDLAEGEEPDITVVARTAGTSEHHFRRMFSTLAGMPVSMYIRRRRLTLAAYDVVGSESTLLDVAVRHGYGSTEAFNRAFRTVHGISAGQARRQDLELVSQPRISFHLTVDGKTTMRYRIVEKESFWIVGKATRVPLVQLGPNESIIAFERGLGPAVREAVQAASDQEPHGSLSVTDAVDESRAEGTWLDYWHGAVSASGPPDGLDGVAVEAGTWVVFSVSGGYPEAMQNLWRDAYGEWFPANPWQTRPGPEMLKTEVGTDGQADAELWLPVEKSGPESATPRGTS